MNKDLYPVTSGHLIIKYVADNRFAVKDAVSKKTGYANESLKDLLLLCDGTKTVNSILTTLAKQYDDTVEEIERKVGRSLRYLEGLGFIQFAEKAAPSPLIFYNRRLPWPLNLVYIEVTNRCNLSCIHCYADANRAMEELATTQVLRLIDQLSELEVMDIVLTGGEPLVRSDIFDIMDYVAEKNMSIHLFTNGVLLDENKIQKLKQLNVETVAVSLDGATPETHNRIRGSDCFDKVLNNIELLTKMGIHTRINTAFYRDNLAELEKLMELLVGMGVHEIQIDYLMPYGRGASCKDLILPFDESEEIAFRYYRQMSSIEREKRVKIPELKMEDSTSVQSAETRKFSLCGIGTRACTIRSNGDVVLCPVLCSKEFVAGNAMKKPLERIWLDSEIFSPLRNHCVNDIAKCKACIHKGYCVGGCKAKAYLLQGRFDAPDPLICLHYRGYERWKNTAQPLKS